MASLSRKTVLLSIIIMVGLTIITYSNHFNNSFHFDDSHSVVNNPYIRNIENIPLFFKDGQTSSVLPQNQSYRPVVSTTLAIDYWLGNGYNLFYFHLSSFIIFLLQGILMILLFNKIFDSALPKKNNIYIAIIATSWYLLHPAIAETINYVIARSDLLSTFFVVLGFVLYIYSPFCRKTFLYLLPIGIGALAKPPSVMFAPILFFYILFFEEQLSLFDLFKFKLLWKVVMKTLPSIIFCGFMYVLIDKFTPASWIPGGSSPLQYLITQPFVILHYFGTLFLPIGLSADSDWSLLPGIGDIRFFIGAAFILLMLALAFYTSKKSELRPISFGILWFFLALVPTSSIIPLAEVLNDHRMFFPFIGLVMSVTWAAGLGISKLVQSAKPTGKYATAILIPVLLLLSAYAYGTYQRNKVWNTEESLWYDVTIKSPDNGRGMMNYGLTLMAKAQYDSAETYFNRALVTLPAYSTLYINLAVLKEAKGDKITAENYYLKAIQLGVNYQDPYFYYARFLSGQGRHPEAIAQLKKALEVSPGYLDARLLLMSEYEATEQWDNLKLLAENTLQMVPDNEAVQQYLQAARTRKSKLDVEAAMVKSAPTAEKYLTLSLQYYQAGKYAECIDAAAEAVKLKPDYAEAYNNMGSAYNILQQYDKAVEVLKKAVAIKPDFQLAKNNLAAAQASLIVNSKSPAATDVKLDADGYLNISLTYFNQGQYQKCIDACYKALALNPNFDLAYNNICCAYNKMSQWDKAIEAGEKGLKSNPNNQLLKNNLQESYRNRKK